MGDITPPAVPTTFDKFVAALKTLYLRYSVRFDAAATLGLSWLLSKTQVEQEAFLAHFHVAPWAVPPMLFIARQLFTATPQPNVAVVTAAKAVDRAEKRADDSAAP